MKSHANLIREAGIVNFDEPIPESMVNYLIDLVRADAIAFTSQPEKVPGWEDAIVAACEGGHAWIPRKFIQRLRDHQERYPAFKPERVAEMFIAESPKVRASYCYRDISEFTKSIRKANSFRSLCDSQS